MIKRAHKMEILMDYQSLSLFPNVRLPPKFKMPTLDKFDKTSCLKSYLKMYMKVMQPLEATEELLRPNKITFTEKIKWQRLREERCKHKDNTRCVIEEETKALGVKPLHRSPSGK